MSHLPRFARMPHHAVVFVAIAITLIATLAAPSASVTTARQNRTCPDGWQLLANGICSAPDISVEVPAELQSIATEPARVQIDSRDDTNRHGSPNGAQLRDPIINDGTEDGIRRQINNMPYICPGNLQPPDPGTTNWFRTEWLIETCDPAGVSVGFNLRSEQDGETVFDSESTHGGNDHVASFSALGPYTYDLFEEFPHSVTEVDEVLPVVRCKAYFENGSSSGFQSAPVDWMFNDNILIGFSQNMDGVTTMVCYWFHFS